MSSSTSMLTPKQKYAAGALFALALHQVQIHQTLPLGFLPAAPDHRFFSANDSSTDSVYEDPHLWAHHSSGLLRPVFKFLEIDSKEWARLEETATHSSAERRHVAVFVRQLMDESGDMSSEAAEKEVSVAKGIDAMSSSMEKTPAEYDSKKEKQREYEQACREKFPDPDTIPEAKSEELNIPDNSQQETKTTKSIAEQAQGTPMLESVGKQMEEAPMLSYPRKVTVLYQLLSACLADIPEDNNKSTKRRKGYDARHRVALRLLAAWFDIKWMKMEAIEMVVACSAMALWKEEESKEQGGSPGSTWDKWKHGGIIGAAALTGGTLMAITGGLAAPAIAIGFGALAPTLGTIIPVIGASGFAAVASAAGSVAGSVAVAASFGAAGAGLSGTKMARRIGDVDEFEFKAIGENHNQGRLAVEISISGFVFEEEDFIRPWEEQHDKLERYALQWESQHLIAVSTAIQDWLTSSIAREVMKRGAMMTVLGTLTAALVWPATLLSLTDFIDSKWTIAIDRSDKAGKLLAEALLKGLQGHRCLQILAESEANAAGIVERVVLLGAPVAIKDENWEATRKVVVGRYVNAYSTKDWMLGIAFRARYQLSCHDVLYLNSLLTKGLAGIQPVDVPGIENVDVTDIIEGHSSYLWGSQLILDQLELDTHYPVFNQKSS
ncbi:UNVERIFIED_CONTAM: Transmembrane and coiled-coil domain-containing protein 4 [Sesamum radiatum]|uniref:Transmembrane and coiled-coil domain-containing protein 4 n=1 Tax=Sesamum radiatum TaxID=300843 RepID=A0AAW2V5W6_SESRA